MTRILSLENADVRAILSNEVLKIGKTLIRIRGLDTT